MADSLSRAQRSKRMSLVRGKNTGPELIVRKLVHRMGYRYGVHGKDLPGCPDLVFRARRKVIFVHGCFWHRHNCGRGTRPKQNKKFWKEKLDRNRARDKDVLRSLKRLGWKAMFVWECQTR